MAMLMSLWLWRPLAMASWRVAGYQTLGTCFSLFSLPSQHATAPNTVASSLANLDNKISPETSPMFFSPPTSPVFYTPPTSPVDFISRAPANPTLNGYVITGNEIPIVTGGADFLATSARSPGPAVIGNRGQDLANRRAGSAFTVVTSTATVCPSTVNRTSQISITSESPSILARSPSPTSIKARDYESLSQRARSAFTSAAKTAANFSPTAYCTGKTRIFTASPSSAVSSPYSADKGKRGMGSETELTKSVLAPDVSTVPGLSLIADRTTPTSLISTPSTSVVSKQISAVVNKPVLGLGRGKTTTFTLDPNAPIFRPRAKTSSDLSNVQEINSDSSLLSAYDSSSSSCKVTCVCNDAFDCHLDGYHPTRPPDDVADDGVTFHHPPRPPDFSDVSPNTSPKEFSFFRPQMSFQTSPSVCSIETSDVIEDLSVPSHLQALFDTTLETIELSVSNKRKLASVLQRNSCAFATDPLDLGYCDVLHHDIDTGNSLPIKQSPRRPPISAREAEDKILDEMLKTGVIEPSNSPWSSPVCLVKKRDETYRFCIDYRRVNDVTKKDAHPLPDIKDALDSLKGARYYATVDLLNGYWQLPMTERAKERSAFCTRRGLFNLRGCLLT